MNTFNRVSEWNEKAGNVPAQVGSDEYFENLYNQAERVKEELQELYQAIAQRDIRGIVDAGLDLDVVVAGVNYLSKCDYAGGINAVLNNNDLKIAYSYAEAEEWAEHYITRGVEVYIQSGYCAKTDRGCYTLRRKSDNKILKYENFPAVDLTSFVPAQEIVYITLVKNSEVILPDIAKLFQVLSLDSIEEPSREVLQKVLEQSGQDAVRLVVQLPDNEIIRIDSYEETVEVV